MSMVTITHPFSSFSLRKSASLSPSISFRVRHRLASSRWLTYQPKRFPCIHRFDNSSLKCSITNTNVHFNDVGIDEEVREELPNVEDNCSVPLVHLKSDILEDESLRLLNEDAFADSLLTTLPVLSEDEQKKLAATPVHPVGLYALYASCFAGNLVEQLWNIAWPSAIALLYPSLLPVAVVGFCSKITIIAGGPLIGRLMDHFPRVMAFSCLNIVQAVGQLISATMIIYAHSSRLTSSSSLLLHPWFLILILAGSFERLAGVSLGVAMERDWVVLLAGVNRPVALAQANAILQRIDLLCEMAGASLFSILLSKYDPVTCLKITGALMILSLPVVLAFGYLTNKLSSGVLDRSRSLHTNFKSCDRERQSGVDNIVHSGLEAIKLGWKEYLQQPVLPASLAYVLLFFNVVLGPGSLMAAFLTQKGLDPSIIGGFSGLCAFMGVAATFISANLVRQFGLLKAGAVGLIYQASLLTVAVAVYWGESLSRQKSILFFLSLIVLSRLGHMSYDIVGQQILQTGIPESKANIIGTTEVSVASVAECLMLGVAIIANDVSNYGFLAILSLLSVIGAAWLFCHWLLHPTDEQRTLFSFDPHPI